MKTQTKKRILLIDNYDSFTYNLQDYFLQLNTECKVIRNDELSLDAIKAIPFDGLVLSPGPKTPKDAGIMISLIDYYHDKTPILGICLGHQGIGEYFGAKLTKADSPMHGKTSVIQHQQHPLFKDLPEQFNVMRYHSLIIEQLEDTPLNAIANTGDEIMAIAHRSRLIIGVQFHPESILTEYGLSMLNNWLDLVEKEKIYIREMDFSEAKMVRNVCKKAYRHNLEKESSEEAKEHFFNTVISKKLIKERKANGSHFHVAIKDGVVIGATELRPPGHLALVFVDPDFQGIGLGKRMMFHAKELAKVLFPDANSLTLNATPNAVDFYLKLNFEKTNELQEKNGIRYLPMQTLL